MSSTHTQLFRKIRDLNFRMEVLEYFEWDEAKRDKFISDLEVHLNNSTTVEELKVVLNANYSATLVNTVWKIIKTLEEDMTSDNKKGGSYEA